MIIASRARRRILSVSFVSSRFFPLLLSSAVSYRSSALNSSVSSFICSQQQCLIVHLLSTAVSHRSSALNSSFSSLFCSQQQFLIVVLLSTAVSYRCSARVAVSSTITFCTLILFCSLRIGFVCFKSPGGGRGGRRMTKVTIKWCCVIEMETARHGNADEQPAPLC